MDETILIVEDEVITAMALEDCLTSMGYVVVGSVSSGQAAVSEATTYQPDLILMDVFLQGDMDGIEAATEIQKQSDAPIIFLSALAGEDVVQRAMATEPYGYIIKPYREMQLKLSIDIALNSAHLKRQARKDEEALRRSETMRRAITDAAKDCIFCKNADRRYTFINPAMEALIKFPASEILGKTAAEVFGPEAAIVIDAVDEPVLRGEVVDAIRTLTIGDRELTFHTVQTPLLDGGEVIGICGIVRQLDTQQRH